MAAAKKVQNFLETIFIEPILPRVLSRKD